MHPIVLSTEEKVWEKKDVFVYNAVVFNYTLFQNEVDVCNNNGENSFLSLSKFPTDGIYSTGARQIIVYVVNRYFLNYIA